MPCPFCIEAASPESGLRLLGETWPFRDRVLCDFQSSFAIAGFGPLVYPYALVLPKRHVMNYLCTSTSERESIFDCLDALLIQSEFSNGSLVVLEHGGCGGPSSACIAHCHLHVFDGAMHIDEWMDEELAGATFIELDSALPSPAHPDYLFAGRYGGDRRLPGRIAPDDQRTPQFFRQVIASRLSLGNWNWRIGMNPDMMIRLVQKSRIAPPDRTITGAP